jgi:hypothetical protein
MYLPEVNKRMLLDGEPDIDFCFMIVNHQWKNPVERSHQPFRYNLTDEFIGSLAEFFKHPRYIHMDGHPVLYLYQIVNTIPPGWLTSLTTKLSQHGIPKPYFVGSIQLHGGVVNQKVPGFDAYAEFGPNIGGLFWSYGYTNYKWTENYHLSLTTNFDNSHRVSNGNPEKLPNLTLTKGRYLSPMEETPSEFYERCVSRVSLWYKHQRKEKIVTIFAFNEWSEQASLEPSDLHKYGYLEAIRECKLEAMERVESCGW